MDYNNAMILLDIPDYILNSYQKSYDKPGHTSGISTLEGYLPLQSINYEIQIHSSISHVELKQTFYNNLDNPIDADYIFAISPDAAFVSLQAEINGKTLIGQIKEKEVAKQEYEQAISEGKQAAYSQILEGIHDMMILKLGNLQPNAQCIITYKYVEKLKIVLNKFWQLYIPTNISPRSTMYTDSTNQKYANQGSQQSDLINQNVEWTVNVKLYYQDGQNNDIEFIDSPTHQLDIIQTELSSYLYIQLNPNQQNYPKKPYELLFRNSITNEPGYMLSYLENNQEDYPYAAEITFYPDFNTDTIQQSFNKYLNGDIDYIIQNQNAYNDERNRNNYIFLLDRSGSMAGNSWNTAINTLKYAIQNLPSDSYFDIISFGSYGQTMFKRPVKIDEIPPNLQLEDQQYEIQLEKQREFEQEKKDSDKQKKVIVNILIVLGIYAVIVIITCLIQHKQVQKKQNNILKQNQQQQYIQTQNFQQQMQQPQQYYQNQNQTYNQQQGQFYQQQQLQTQQIHTHQQLYEQNEKIYIQQQPLQLQQQNQKNNKICSNNFLGCQIMLFLCAGIVCFIVFIISAFQGFGEEEDYIYCDFYYSNNEYNVDVLNFEKTSRQNALDLLEQFQPDLGGNNIYYPLEGMYQSLNKDSQFKNLPLNIFLITDGAVSNPDEIVYLVKSKTEEYQYQRYYSIGIGKSVDLSLVMNVAKAGNGLHSFVLDGSQIQDKFEYLFQDSKSYFINNFSLSFDSTIVEATIPKIEQMPIIRKNQAFSIFIMLNKNFSTQEFTNVQLSYYNSLTRQQVNNTIKIQRQNANINQSVIHSLAIKKLLDSILFNSIYGTSWAQSIYIKSEWNSLYYQSVYLSKKYQVLSEFTSFILVEQNDQTQGNLTSEIDNLEEFQSEEQKAVYENTRAQQLKSSGNIFILINNMIIIILTFCFFIL